jgi:hypothetical protein
MIHAPPALLREEDYDAIEAAVMETARGRWFLAEFARRNRNADTAAVLGAIERLERAVAPRPAELSAELAGMRAALETIRSELLAAGRLPSAPPTTAEAEASGPAHAAEARAGGEDRRTDAPPPLLIAPARPPVPAAEDEEADAVTVRVDFAELSFAERAALFS